jgi:hypothetical protein
MHQIAAAIILKSPAIFLAGNGFATRRRFRVFQMDRWRAFVMQFRESNYRLIFVLLWLALAVVLAAGWWFAS